MQLAWGYAPSLILEVAVRHRIFDVVNKGARTVEQVSLETGASNRGLRPIMNALVGLNFLAKDSGERYSLTPESETFLLSSKPTFFGGFFRHISTSLLPNWLKLYEVVRTGNPQIPLNREESGTPFFQAFVEDLFPLAVPAAMAVARLLKIAETSTPLSVLDLAAGSGVWGIVLAQQSPLVRVTAVDWSEVLPVTRRTAEKFGVEERFEYVAGDLLEADFGGGHSIATLGQILHSEGETRSRTLIKKTFDALAPGGTIVIADWLVNEDRTGPPQSLLFAVTMMVNTDEGDTFSFGEISQWLGDAGFVDARSVDAPGPSPLVLATKPGMDGANP